MESQLRCEDEIGKDVDVKSSQGNAAVQGGRPSNAFLSLQAELEKLLRHVTCTHKNFKLKNKIYQLYIHTHTQAGGCRRMDLQRVSAHKQIHNSRFLQTCYLCQTR